MGRTIDALLTAAFAMHLQKAITPIKVTLMELNLLRT